MFSVGGGLPNASNFSVVPTSNLSRRTLEVISFCGTSIGVLP